MTEALCLVLMLYFCLWLFDKIRPYKSHLTKEQIDYCDKVLTAQCKILEGMKGLEYPCGSPLLAELLKEETK